MRRQSGHTDRRLCGFFNPVEQIDLSPLVADEVKTTTCYMCACRCGIRVHLKDGRIRWIQGNPDHPVNRGVLCAKGSAGIMQHYSPARLSKPLLRVGERGDGQLQGNRVGGSAPSRHRMAGRMSAPLSRSKLAFFTGRDQSQSFTGWWAKQFGTPNFAAHGGFCSVNMAAGGLYSVGGSFWEFGDPDWDRTKFFMMFGVAEDHDSNPIKTGLAKLKERGAKYVAVNPVKTGYAAIADEWIGIRPGTDGLFVLALVHELLRTDRIDFDFLARYTNAAWLVVQNPAARTTACSPATATASRCLGPRDELAIDAARRGCSHSIVGEVTLPDGRPPAGVPSAGRTLPGRPLRAGGGGRSLRRPRRHDPPHRQRARRHRL